MSTRRPDLPALSESQREIMEIIWELGEASARSVRERLLQHRDVARNTVRTLLERMEVKGWLSHRQQGRTFLYSATQPRESAVGRQVMDVMDQVCGGSPEALMTAILDYRGLSSAELQRIRDLLDDAKSNANAKVKVKVKTTKKRGH